MADRSPLLRFALRSSPPTRNSARIFDADTGSRLLLLAAEGATTDAAGVCAARLAGLTASGRAFLEEAGDALGRPDAGLPLGDVGETAGFHGVLLAFIGRDVWWIGAGPHAIWRLRSSARERLSPRPSDDPGAVESGHARLRRGDRLVVADRAFEPAAAWREACGTGGTPTVAATVLVKALDDAAPISLAVVDVVRLPSLRFTSLVTAALAAAALGLGGSWLTLSLLFPAAEPTASPPAAASLSTGPASAKSARWSHPPPPLPAPRSATSPSLPRPSDALRRAAVRHNRAWLARCPAARAELIDWFARVRGEVIASPDGLADAIFARQAGRAGESADGRVDEKLLLALGLECS